MGGKPRSRALALVTALLAAAYVDRGPPQKKIDPAYIEANLLAGEPAAMQNRVDADFGGKVVYLGNDVDTVNLTPGGNARILHYWKVIEPPGSDWRIFSHVLGTGTEWMNVDDTDMRAGYPTSKWKAGDVIRDEQKFALERGWKSDFAELAVGLYRKGSHGIDGRMPLVSGPSDGEHRVRVFRFQVDRAGESAAGAPMEYRVRRASGPIAIDGVADEASWAEAPRSAAFTDAEGGRAVSGQTHARLLWDDEHLYAFIEVEDTDIHSPYKKRDDPLWKADCVELFIDADGNGRGYVELQVNPHNAHFDAWFPRTRAQKGDFDWRSGMRSAVVVDGTVDDRSDTDRGWNVEIAIPLADVKGRDDAMNVRIPPQPGDRWKLNIVRVDLPKGSEQVTASSWSPITIQDFHALDRMLEVVFADEQGKTEEPTGEKPEEPPAGAAP
jgi:hypothetical protein